MPPSAFVTQMLLTGPVSSAVCWLTMRCGLAVFGQRVRRRSSSGCEDSESAWVGWEESAFRVDFDKQLGQGHPGRRATTASLRAKTSVSITAVHASPAFSSWTLVL